MSTTRRYLYHLTNKGLLNSIIREGVIPGKIIRAPDADPDRVWFFPSLKGALEDRDMPSQHVDIALKIDTQKLPNRDSIECGNFGYGIWCSYPGRIPSNAIVKIIDI